MLAFRQGTPLTTQQQLAFTLNFGEAVAVLGHERITDMIVLMGYYTAVSLTMNFHAVPAGMTR